MIPSWPTEFLVDVPYVSVNNPGSLVDARWFVPTNGFDEFKDTRCQRLHGIVVAGEGGRRRSVHRLTLFDRRDAIRNIAVELVGRFDDPATDHGHDVTAEGLHIDVYRHGEKYRQEYVTPLMPAGIALDFTEDHLAENVKVSEGDSKNALKSGIGE